MTRIAQQDEGLCRLHSQAEVDVANNSLGARGRITILTASAVLRVQPTRDGNVWTNSR